MNTRPIDIADYDQSDYDYIQFWQTRQYENQSEKIALDKLLPKAGKALIDLGGGFGRLAKLYSPRFSQCILLDYSQKNLDQAKILSQTAGIANLEIKRGNVYDLPFKNKEFDAILMVRIIHHLLEPEKAMLEATRILKPDGTFILEFANKIHLKARIRAWLKGDFGFSKDKNPLNLEPCGLRPAQILVNYHPQHIQQMLESAGFLIKKKISVSNFRIPILKKLIPLPILLFFESCLQRVSELSLFHFYFGPSIFLLCTKKTKTNP